MCRRCPPDPAKLTITFFDGGKPCGSGVLMEGGASGTASPPLHEPDDEGFELDVEGEGAGR
jgi:hypothetical protein